MGSNLSSPPPSHLSSGAAARYRDYKSWLVMRDESGPHSAQESALASINPVDGKGPGVSSSHKANTSSTTPTIERGSSLLEPDAPSPPLSEHLGAPDDRRPGTSPSSPPPGQPNRASPPPSVTRSLLLEHLRESIALADQLLGSGSDGPPDMPTTDLVGIASPALARRRASTALVQNNAGVMSPLPLPPMFSTPARRSVMNSGSLETPSARSVSRLQRLAQPEVDSSPPAEAQEPAVPAPSVVLSAGGVILAPSSLPADADAFAAQGGVLPADATNNGGDGDGIPDFDALMEAATAAQASTAHVAAATPATGRSHAPSAASASETAASAPPSARRRRGSRGSVAPPLSPAGTPGASSYPTVAQTRAEVGEMLALAERLTRLIGEASPQPRAAGHGAEGAGACALIVAACASPVLAAQPSDSSIVDASVEDSSNADLAARLESLLLAAEAGDGDPDVEAAALDAMTELVQQTLVRDEAGSGSGQGCPAIPALHLPAQLPGASRAPAVTPRRVTDASEGSPGRSPGRSQRGRSAAEYHAAVTAVLGPTLPSPPRSVARSGSTVHTAGARVGRLRGRSAGPSASLHSSIYSEVDPRSARRSTDGAGLHNATASDASTPALSRPAPASKSRVEETNVDGPRPRANFRAVSAGAATRRANPSASKAAVEKVPVMGKTGSLNRAQPTSTSTQQRMTGAGTAVSGSGGGSAFFAFGRTHPHLAHVTRPIGASRRSLTSAPTAGPHDITSRPKGGGVLARPWVDPAVACAPPPACAGSAGDLNGQLQRPVLALASAAESSASNAASSSGGVSGSASKIPVRSPKSRPASPPVGGPSEPMMALSLQLPSTAPSAALQSSARAASDDPGLQLMEELQAGGGGLSATASSGIRTAARPSAGGGTVSLQSYLALTSSLLASPPPLPPPGRKLTSTAAVPPQAQVAAHQTVVQPQAQPEQEVPSPIKPAASGTRSTPLQVLSTRSTIANPLHLLVPQPTPQWKGPASLQHAPLPVTVGSGGGAPMFAPHFGGRPLAQSAAGAPQLAPSASPRANPRVPILSRTPTQPAAPPAVSMREPHGPAIANPLQLRPGGAGIVHVSSGGIMPVSSLATSFAPPSSARPLVPVASLVSPSHAPKDKPRSRASRGEAGPAASAFGDSRGEAAPDVAASTAIVRQLSWPSALETSAAAASPAPHAAPARAASLPELPAPVPRGRPTSAASRPPPSAVFRAEAPALSAAGDRAQPSRPASAGATIGFGARGADAVFATRTSASSAGSAGSSFLAMQLQFDSAHGDA